MTTKGEQLKTALQGMVNVFERITGERCSCSFGEPCAICKAMDAARAALKEANQPPKTPKGTIKDQEED